MRNQLIELIFKDFKKNKKIFFLTGDLGFSVLEPLKKISKERFINMGISENNMMLSAVGLSALNNTVYVYSISPFITLRNLEIIRNYLSNERRDIKIIGVGSGVSYGKLGKTHFNLDDINAIYSLKNILIINPSNIDELNYLYRKYSKYKGPIYFRINKNAFNTKLKFQKFENFFLKKGKKGNLIVSGAILNHITDLLTKSEVANLNIISIPVISSRLSYNFKSKLVKGKILTICDSSFNIFFEQLKNSLNLKNYKFFYNFGLDHNRIKTVGDEKNILKQMEVNRKNIIKYLF